MAETATSKVSRATKASKGATPEAVAQTIFTSLAKKDLSVFEDLVHPDAVDNFLAIGEFRGRDAIRGFFEELFTAFPEFDLQMERVVADDHTAVVQWHATGTFIGGPFLGIEPTGRHVEIRGVDVMEVEDGQLRHNTIYYDGATFAREIGLLPKRDSGVDRAMLASFNAVTRLRSRLRT